MYNEPSEMYTEKVHQTLFFVVGIHCVYRIYFVHVCYTPNETSIIYQYLYENFIFFSVEWAIFTSSTTYNKIIQSTYIITPKITSSLLRCIFSLLWKIIRITPSGDNTNYLVEYIIEKCDQPLLYDALIYIHPI